MHGLRLLETNHKTKFKFANTPKTSTPAFTPTLLNTLNPIRLFK